MTPQSPTPSKSTNQDVVDAARQRLIGLLKKQDPPAKVKTLPKNTAWLARLGFNGAMLFLDIISGITVGMISFAFYGVATVVSGILALLLHEKLFENPHANESQKLIAIGGGVIAVVSTLLVGLAAGIVNVFSIDALIAGKFIESVMIGFLVMSIFAHGILWGWYYFTDPSHVAEMKRMVHIAFRQQTRDGIEEAKQDVAEVIEMDKTLQHYADNGLFEVLVAAFSEARGRELVNPNVGPLDPATQTALNALSPVAPTSTVPQPVSNISLQNMPANVPTPVSPAPIPVSNGNGNGNGATPTTNSPSLPTN